MLNFFVVKVAIVFSARPWLPPPTLGQSAVSAASGPHPRATAPPPRDCHVTRYGPIRAQYPELTANESPASPPPPSCNVPIITNHLAPVSWSRRPRPVTLDTRNKDSDHQCTVTQQP